MIVTPPDLLGKTRTEFNNDSKKGLIKFSLTKSSAFKTNRNRNFSIFYKSYLFLILLKAHKNSKAS